MKKFFNRKIIFLMFILCMTILLLPQKTLAVGLQANKGGTSLVNVDRDSMWYSIRQMEDSHGTLGIVNDTDNSKNGIDCHMAKNTEWGTIAMLSASRYGEVHQETDETADSNSTTGNKSGIYQMGSGKLEWTATRQPGWESGKYSIYKYWNLHSSGNDAINGEATCCYRWFIAYRSELSCPGYGVQRRGGDRLFNFYRTGDESAKYDTTSRAIVVCGEGL